MKVIIFAFAFLFVAVACLLSFAPWGDELSPAMALFESSQTPTASPAPTASPTLTPVSTCRCQHIVAPDETLFRIAIRYGVTVDEIMRANDFIEDEDSIQVGLILCIPW